MGRWKGPRAGERGSRVLGGEERGRKDGAEAGASRRKPGPAGRHTHTQPGVRGAIPLRLSSGQKVGSLLPLGPSLQIMDRHPLPAPQLLLLI